MNSTAVLLILGFCISEALYNIAVGAETAGSRWEGKMPWFNAGICFLAALLLFAAASPAIISGELKLDTRWWGLIFLTGILFTGIVYCETKSLSFAGEVSRVAPIGATTPAFMALIAMFVHREYPSLIGWCGISAIVVGTYCTRIQSAISSKDALGREIGKRHLRDLTLKDWFKPFALVASSTAVLYAYGNLVFGMFSINVEAEVVRQTNVAFASGCIVALGAVGNLIVYRLFRPAGQTITSNMFGMLVRPRVLVVGVCLFLSMWTASAALTYADVAYVGALKRLQIPLTMVLAYLVLRERDNFGERFVGGFIMTLGAVLLAFS